MNAISPTLNTISPDNLAPEGDRSRLQREEFLKLLTAQLTHQNPLEPMDNTKVLEQLSLLEDLEATSQLTETLQSMVRAQQLGGAAGLLGKQILAVDENGMTVEGIASGLSAGPEGVRLTVNGTSIPLELIQQVSEPADEAQ